MKKQKKTFSQRSVVKKQSYPNFDRKLHKFQPSHSQLSRELRAMYPNTHKADIIAITIGVILLFSLAAYRV